MYLWIQNITQHIKHINSRIELLEMQPSTEYSEMEIWLLMREKEILSSAQYDLMELQKKILLSKKQRV